MNSGHAFFVPNFSKFIAQLCQGTAQLSFCGKVSFERRDEAMQKITTTLKKTIAYLAKKSASMEANTACPCVGFQPKESKTVKKLRKF